MAQTNDEIKQKWHIGNKRENQLLKRFVLDNKMQGWVDSLIDGAIDEARLAALDDCKTLLERPTKRRIVGHEIRGLAKARELILAELEALRKKVKT